jgi:hypothetical protein
MDRTIGQNVPGDVPGQSEQSFKVLGKDSRADLIKSPLKEGTLWIRRTLATSLTLMLMENNS